MNVLRKYWLELTLLVLLISGAGAYAIWNSRMTKERELVSGLVDSEELLLAITPRLKKLSHGAKNLKILDHQSRGLFAAEFELLGLVNAEEENGHRSFKSSNKKSSVRSEDAQLWHPLLADIKYFDKAKFYFVNGSIDDSGRFQSKIGFSGLAKLASGDWEAIKVKSAVTWENQNDNDTISDWKIVDWKTKDIHISTSQSLYYKEVLKEVLPNEDDRVAATINKHDQYVISAVKTGTITLANKRYRDFFVITAAGQHPGLSVADVDGDGWDDIYVMVRWSKNLLFHNQGDGTFVESAEKFGLDVAGLSTGGVFADFDNDGDLDLFLGRTLERSEFFLNEGGYFFKATKRWFDQPLPYLVTSVSAVDYNNDGLLDLYLSTYGMPGRGKSGADQWISAFLPAEQAEKLLAMYSDPDVGYNRFMNAIGPPNLLLVNRGGKFEIAPENHQVAQWYNTLQATWGDFDNDGYADLYVANDFAPDALFRNLKGAGFENITPEIGHSTMQGFGMGTSWGDYDNDGFLDLYVSNMYSKAGMRITDQLPNLDQRFRMSANGNRLYRFNGEKFELTSDNDQDGIAVTKAGWSWGGQFLDVNNDGYQDIYVTSGYRTVPPEVATDVDL